jgi:hypothetical protein
MIMAIYTMHDTHPYNLQPNKLVVVCITTLNHDPDSNGFKQHCIYMVHTHANCNCNVNLIMIMIMDPELCS